MDVKLDDLIAINPNDLTVKSRESLHREFKELYEKKSLPKYAKTLAAMANTDGGFLFFGIADKPNRLVGIDPRTFPDAATLSNALENWFDPHFNIEIQEYEYAGLVVIAIRIQESHIKPVICKKNATIVVEAKKDGRIEKIDKQLLSEGAIYRRYFGKTEQIHFAELYEIFAERDRKIYQSLMETMKNIQRVGVERVGIVDVSSMEIGAGLSRIYLSKEAIDNLNLIDKGKFVETEDEGETSYFVAGTVQLHEATEVPVDDEDRIKPGQTAKMLSEDARKYLFPSFNLSFTHLAKYSRETGIRDDHENYDNRYCKWDEQAEQWFYRQAFVELLKKKLREQPRDTLEKLSSTANLDKFDEHQRRVYIP